MKIKITYILSEIDKAVAFEWIASNINQEEFELSFILLNNKEPYLFQWLNNKKIEVYYIQHLGKVSYFLSLFRVLKILFNIKPDVVHAHLLDANLIGLLAAKLIGVKKRIYTRHHSTFHHEYYPRAVRWDKLTNILASHIVAISENVQDVLMTKESVLLKKINLIHHGFDLDKFRNVNQCDISELKIKYSLSNSDSPIIGVIARHIEWKGIQYIIPAFKQLLTDYPNAILILANSKGAYNGKVKSIIQHNLEPNQYRLIPFEPNLYALYQLFDIYVHVPINKNVEAFGQTYVEALVSGIPSVFTISGIANEFIKHKENALVVDYKNSSEIFYAVQSLLGSESLRQKLISNGRKSTEQFNLSLFIHKLEGLYE